VSHCHNPSRGCPADLDYGCVCRCYPCLTLANRDSGAELAPITLCLVGCGKTKLDRLTAAKDLYTGNLFRAARSWAETCDEWRILSALYGLVDPEQQLAPYEHRLHPKDRAQWGQVVANRIVCEMSECGPFELVILAGKDYAAPVVAGMRSGLGWRCNCVDVRQPLAGMGIGRRLGWFAAEART